MTRRVPLAFLLVVVPFLQVSSTAQVRRGTLEAPNEVDAGVFAATLLETTEVLVARVQVRPGSVRRVHQHNDVAFHLLVTLDGSLQLTGAQNPTETKEWQVVYMKAGTPHGFHNNGSATVTAIEVLVRPRMSAAGPEERRDLAAQALAQALTSVR
jgi:quercetin dioxygenase-like cupin family protein